ncbi:MAG: stage III sporulation protein AC, partial [Clostridia bacterium]
LLFKIAGIGILVSVINLVLTKSGREEIAMLTTITGLIIVLMLVVVQIGDLFDVVKNVFRL